MIEGYLLAHKDDFCQKAMAKNRVELIENSKYKIAIGVNLSYIYNQAIKLIDKYRTDINDFILIKYTYDSKYDRFIIYKCSFDNIKKLLLLSD